jgi:hypothetical protein
MGRLLMGLEGGGGDLGPGVEKREGGGMRNDTWRCVLLLVPFVPLM